MSMMATAETPAFDRPDAADWLAKPFFIGLLVGEALSAGFWLVTHILLATSGYAFHAVRSMPG
jgi:hypothetical protein